MSKELLDDIVEDDISTNSTDDKSTESTDDSIPEHLQGKSPEELVKMIQEGQRKITELSTKSKETQSSDSNSDDDGELGDILGEDKPKDNNDTSTKDKGLDYEQLKDRFMKAETEEEQNKVLEMIDKKKDSDVLKNTFKNSIINEKNSITEFRKKAISEIHETAGSREEFLNLMKVVKAEMGEAEVEQFSATFKAGNLNSAKNLVEFYKYKLSDKLGKESSDGDKDTSGESFNGEAGGKAGPEKYSEKDEYYSDLNSQKYKKDLKFREQVKAKAKAAKFI